jgi:hypothetical protein
VAGGGGKGGRATFEAAAVAVFAKKRAGAVLCQQRAPAPDSPLPRRRGRRLAGAAAVVGAGRGAAGGARGVGFCKRGRGPKSQACRLLAQFKEGGAGRPASGRQLGWPVARAFRNGPKPHGEMSNVCREAARRRAPRPRPATQTRVVRRGQRQAPARGLGAGRCAWSRGDKRGPKTRGRLCHAAGDGCMLKIRRG